jgi:hypothetical protein
VKVQKKAARLGKMSTEELRKWAKAYGIDNTVDTREALLEQLAPFADGIVDTFRPANLPLEPPKFTLKTIKVRVSHCTLQYDT